MTEFGTVTVDTALASKTWGATPSLVWVDDGSGVPWLAQVWQCYETGELEYKPLPTVKLPPSQDKIDG